MNAVELLTSEKSIRDWIRLRSKIKTHTDLMECIAYGLFILISAFQFLFLRGLSFDATSPVLIHLIDLLIGISSGMLAICIASFVFFLSISDSKFIEKIATTEIPDEEKRIKNFSITYLKSSALSFIEAIVCPLILIAHAILFEVCVYVVSLLKLSPADWDSIFYVFLCNFLFSQIMGIITLLRLRDLIFNQTHIAMAITRLKLD